MSASAEVPTARHYLALVAVALAALAFVAMVRSFVAGPDIRAPAKTYVPSADIAPSGDDCPTLESCQDIYP